MEDLKLQEQAKSRIAGHLVDSDKFAGEIEARISILEEARVGLASLESMTDIDASEGVQLDIIGAIVGQPRRVEKAVSKWFFGWDDEGHALGFGEADDPSVGGVWYTEGDGTTASALLDDVTYRRCIRMRVAYNTTGSDPDKPMLEYVYDVLRLIFPDWSPDAYELTVYDEGGMCLTCYVGVQPDDLQTALLKYAHVVPLNSCVSMTILVGGTFAFDDSPGTGLLGFDEESAPGGGGTFAEEL